MTKITVMPDLHGTKKEQFKSIQEEYEVLSAKRNKQVNIQASKDFIKRKTKK